MTRRPSKHWWIVGFTRATSDELMTKETCISLAEGNLYLVGRSKDIIVDTNGKNVYPDEVEEVYQDSPYIKELSVVGYPDGIGEKVACIVVPNYEYDIALTRAALQAAMEENFREFS